MQEGMRLMNYCMQMTFLQERSYGRLEKRFWNWEDALEIKGLNVNTRKTKVMVSGLEGELFKSKIEPCGVSGRRVMSNSVVCTKFGNWVYGR